MVAGYKVKIAAAYRWNFTTLHNKDYCVSKQFDATDMNDLKQIVFILRKLKDLILNRIS
jgi:hypothetical protein